MQEPGFIKRGGKYVPCLIIEKASGAIWAELPSGLAVIGCPEEPIDEIEDSLIDGIDNFDITGALRKI